MRSASEVDASPPELEDATPGPEVDPAPLSVLASALPVASTLVLMSEDGTPVDVDITVSPPEDASPAVPTAGEHDARTTTPTSNTSSMSADASTEHAG